MSKSPVALAGSVLLLFLGAGLTAWGVATWFEGRRPGDDWDRGTAQFLTLILLLFGLLFLAAGTMQLVQRRRPR